MNQEALDIFYNYKNNLIGELVTNEEIISLLTDDEELISHPEKLIYSQLFPLEYVPDTIQHAKTYICCDVDIQKAAGRPLFEPVFHIWIFTHKSLLILPDGKGVRVDRLASKIADILDGSHYYGMGELEFYSSKRFAPIADYQGKVLTFTTTDWAKVPPNNKPIPSNRKNEVPWQQ